ncbi:MAG: VPLPA-CTERM-specific exosortase XrtD [Proteobacteria bacterium]|nr:VPLPA-CTERM-specific exosortase XrtD [Pseudomonadota bacterium]MBU1595296.1 VPLPA-CTERM-specific exosortase XrtD [Pseudomonadota bacterium]
MLDLNLRQGLTTWGLIQAAVLLALLTAIYASSHAVMVSSWNNDDYSYCYLLPAVIGWIIWNKRAKLQALRTSGGWGGLLPLALGVLLYALGEFGSEYYTLYLSSWFMVLALCWFFFGLAVVRELSFVFVLLFTLMPLPQFLSNKLTVQLQLIATQMGEALIRLMGMSVYREGNIIDLGFLQLQVVEACSGLRYLFPLIVLGLVLAYFTKFRLWKNTLLVASAVPISLVLNALRIAVTALASKLLGPEVAEGFSHDFAGWIIFLVSFALLYAVSLLLALLPGEVQADPAPEAPAGQEPEAPPAEQPAPAQGFPLGHRPGARFWAATVVMALVFAGITGRGGQKTPPQSRPFAEFPMQIGPWTGTAQFLDQDILNTLRLSQYILADYQDADKASVNLYVAYYRSQRKGQAIHSPESCLPGTGWSVEEEGVMPLPVEPGKPSESLNRSLASKGPQRVLTYFWFAQHGRRLTTLPALKLSTFYGAITRHRTDGALIRLSTSLAQHEPAAQADARLLRFLRDVEPTLREFVPE